MGVLKLLDFQGIELVGQVRWDNGRGGFQIQGLILECIADLNFPVVVLLKFRPEQGACETHGSCRSVLLMPSSIPGWCL